MREGENVDTPELSLLYPSLAHFSPACDPEKIKPSDLNKGGK